MWLVRDVLWVQKEEAGMLNANINQFWLGVIYMYIYTYISILS